MNYGIGLFFRLISLLTGLFCLMYGGRIFLGSSDEAARVAGPAVFFLGAVCIAIFCCTAAIIRRAAGIRHSGGARLLLPVCGFAAAVVTFAFGLISIMNRGSEGFFVAGHAVCGSALAAICLSAAATAFTGFARVAGNPAETLPATDEPAAKSAGFTARQETIVSCIPILAAAAAWIWALVLLTRAHEPEYLVSGCIMFGAACVCTSLIAFVSGTVRQIRNSYRSSERSTWISLSVAMGVVAFVFGAALLVMEWGGAADYAGFLLIGSGLFCGSVSAAVVLLTKMRQGDHPLAWQLSSIPVCAAMICLFIAAFLVEAAGDTERLLIAARILTGYGAVCFAFFPIVSALEYRAAETVYDRPLSGREKNSASSE